MKLGRSNGYEKQHYCTAKGTDFYPDLSAGDAECGLLYVRREIISFRAVFSLQSDEILTGLCCINEGLISRCLTVGSALLRYLMGGLVIAAVNCYNSTEKGSQIFRTAGSLSVRGETINKNKTKRINFDGRKKCNRRIF